MTHFVYILQCFRDPNDRSDKKYKFYYYRGYTNDIQRRFREHKGCRCKYTKRYKGRITLIYLEEINGRNKKEERKLAMRREKVIKNWSRKYVEKISKLKKEHLQYLINKYFSIIVEY